MTRLDLYGVSYSPWTERARWALDHHGLRYRYREHLPMLGEPLLRLRARRSGLPRATVPLLVHPGGVIGDSLQIMRYADESGGGPSLQSHSGAASEWATRLERALDAARSRVTAAVLGDPEALRESVLPVSGARLAGLLRPLAAQGARFIARKYAADLSQETEQLEVIRGACLDIRAALEGRRYLLGDQLSAVDILAASLLQGIQPVRGKGPKMLPAQRRAWTRTEIAEEFSDLLEYRDQLYDTCR